MMNDLAKFCILSGESPYSFPLLVSQEIMHVPRAMSTSPPAHPRNMIIEFSLGKLSSPIDTNYKSLHGSHCGIVPPTNQKVPPLHKILALDFYSSKFKMNRHGVSPYVEQ